MTVVSDASGPIAMDLGVSDVHKPGAMGRKPSEVQMATISTGKRNALPDSKFALPAQRKFPIHDASHVRNAAARLAQVKKAGKISDADFRTARAAIRRAAKRFGIKSELKDLGPSQAMSKPAGGVRVRADLGPGGRLHVRHMSDDGRFALMGDDTLVVMRAVTLGAEVDPTLAGVQLKGQSSWGDGSPKKLVWVQLAEVGAWKGHPAGEFEMTPATFSEIVDNFKRRGLPVPFDFEHASEQDPTKGTIPVNGAPAQGWIHSLENRGEGGLWGLVEWLTDYVRDGIKSGQFAYLSPAIRFGSRDPVSGKPSGARLTSAAITNQPFLTHLAGLIAASDRSGDRMADKIQFQGGAKALLASIAEEPTTVQMPDGMRISVVQMGSALKRLAHKPSAYMPAIKSALKLHELSTPDEVSDHLDKLRDQVEMAMDAGVDPEGMHNGVDLGSFTSPLKYLVDAKPGDTWEEVFDAVEALIDAAMDKHELEYHGGAEMRDAGTTTVAETATQPAAAAPAAATEEQTMATPDPNAAAQTAQMKDFETKLAELTLGLKDVQGKLATAEQTIAAKDGEIKALKDAAAAREEADRKARVEEAFDTYKDAKKLSDADKEAMLLVLTSKPETFEKLYPRVSADKRHLLASLSGGRTEGQSGATVVDPNAEGNDSILPSGPELAMALAIQNGIELGDAQALVFAASRRVAA